jgi:hypothetical protein
VTVTTMTALPDHRSRPSRCPVLVPVNGLTVRCCADTGHTGGHRFAGGDYLDAEHAARATGQLRHPASDTEETEG